MKTMVISHEKERQKKKRGQGKSTYMLYSISPAIPQGLRKPQQCQEDLQKGEVIDIWVPSQQMSVKKLGNCMERGNEVLIFKSMVTSI